MIKEIKKKLLVNTIIFLVAAPIELIFVILPVITDTVTKLLGI